MKTSATDTELGVTEQDRKPEAHSPIGEVLGRAAGTMEGETIADETSAGDSVPDRNLGHERAALAGAREIPCGNPLASHASASAESRLLDVLLILCRRQRLILSTTISGALLAALVTLFLPNRYTATASILPPQQSPSLAASMIGQLGALGPMAAMAQKDLGLKNPNDLYVGMLRSRSCEDALVQRFDLRHAYGDKKMSEAREDLERATAIMLGKEGLVAISVEDKDPRRASAMANAYVEQLRQLTQQLAVTEAGQRRIFFERELETAKSKMADAEQALKETEQKTGLIQLDGQAKAVIESVVKLRAAIAAKEVDLHAMRLFSTERNPDVRLGERELSGMRAQLARLEKQNERSGEAEVSPGGLAAGSVPEAGLQYLRRLREVKYSETIFELLAKQYEAARLDESKTGAVIQVLDSAIEPDRKSSPARASIVVLSAGLAFLGAAGYVLVAAAFARMRLDPAVDASWTVLKQSVFSPS